MKHGATVRYEPRRGKGNVCRQMFRDIDAACYLMVDGDDTYPAEAAKALCEPTSSAVRPIWLSAIGLSNGTYAKANGRAFHGFGNDLVRIMIVDLRLRLFRCHDGVSGHVQALHQDVPRPFRGLPD